MTNIIMSNLFVSRQTLCLPIPCKIGARLYLVRLNEITCF
nr:MAG TPA: hypothetical protein [Caudoviricetes sp.]